MITIKNRNRDKNNELSLCEIGLASCKDTDIDYSCNHQRPWRYGNDSQPILSYRYTAKHVTENSTFTPRPHQRIRALVTRDL